ncbi:MAG TPA: hypothetical protein VGD40_05375 [Chryseosolibacter sp.]
MTQENVKAIKTVSGAIFYALLTYPQMELSGRDWEILCSHLKIHRDCIYSTTVHANGFTLMTKFVCLKYTHNVFASDKRVVELRY